jgi:hypothetical protein
MKRLIAPWTPLDPLGGLLDGMEGREASRASVDDSLGDALTALLLSATCPEALERGLRGLQRRGISGDTDAVLRVLVAGVSSCRTLRPSPREAKALRALGRLVFLAHDARQAAERLTALVQVAIGEFNRGASVRAGRLFDLADRLLATARLDRSLVEPVRANGHRQLDLERLRALIASRQRVSAGMLRLFTVFAPEPLVDRFCREPRHGRRELLLSLIEAHGHAGRAIARQRLLAGHPDDEGAVGHLVQLLWRLPQPAADAPAHAEEVRAVAALLVPYGPPPLVQEALAYLGRAAHPWAERALVLFLRELEGLLLETLPWGERADRLIVALDRTAVALARQRSSTCWAALVEHGLRTEPALGDTAARLVPLGGHDLGAAPDLAVWMIAALNASLPPGFLTPLAESHEPRVLRILAALRGTRMPEVRELLQFLAARFPPQRVGLEAARALEAFDAQPATKPSGASLSGDLRLFGLPALLQNLADGRVTGVLTLDDTARSAATFVFEGGRLRSVRGGARVGASAVYQLLQRPFTGRFSFLHRQGVVTCGGDPPRALALPELILEGLRRFDELQRLASRVPDDAAFQATGRPPTVATEWDIDLVTRLWERASEGASPLACEEALGVDAWQVRRCLAHWLEDASLLPRAGVRLHAA